MVSTLATKLSQCFCPIPAIRQKIDLTRDREAKSLEHLFGNRNFSLKGTTSLGPFRMIEFGLERQKKVFIKQGQEDPLVAKDIGFLSMISMPGTSWNLLACFLGKGVIHDKKEDGIGFDPQSLEKPDQSDLCNFLHGPDVLSQESGKTAKRAVEKGMGKSLNHRRGVHFSAQLDEAEDK